jgi:hypothetical protein
LHNLAYRTARKRFSSLLGVPGLVPEDVFQAALHNEQYASRLIASKEAPLFLDLLMRTPPPRSDRGDISGLRNLVGHFSKAMINWAASGFKFAAEDVVQARIDACTTCPHARLTPAATREGALQSGVCSLCGCPIAQKARLQSEHCPDVRDGNQTRWDIASALHLTLSTTKTIASN